MIPTHIVVPVRDRLDMTISFIHQMWAQSGWDRLTVYDNGSADPTRRYLASVADADDRITIRRAPKLGTYDTWRDGFDRARKEHPGAVNVGIFNSDITLAARTIEHLVTALRSRFELVLTYPDYDLPHNFSPHGAVELRITKGTYKDGGMAGFCFMLAADRVTWAPLISGNDDIAARVDAAGGQQARVEGLGLDLGLQRFGEVLSAQ